MGTSRERHPIIPPDFVDAWDAESVEEALRIAENAPSSTSKDEMHRCPAEGCGSVKLRAKPGEKQANSREGDYQCVACKAHIDERLPPIASYPVDGPVCPTCASWRVRPVPIDGGYRCIDCEDTFEEPFDTVRMTLHTTDPFDWIADDDLADPDERGFGALLAGYDDETLTEVAIRVYRPWDDDGPSYTEIASLTPYSKCWVGDRVRDWKAGEYRELVADPTPSVDASSDATAVATDGGRRRWDAYGSS